MAQPSADPSGKGPRELLRTAGQADHSERRHQGVLRSGAPIIEDIMLTDAIAERSQPVRSLKCLEVWGGNGAVEETLELPGLSVWLHSMPLHNASGGGDVYYLSSCSHGVIARVALADVSGHGECVDHL